MDGPRDESPAEQVVTMGMLEEGYSGRPQQGSSRNRPHGNLNILRASIVLLFGILTIRLGFMQLVHGEEYARRSTENHIVTANILPTRGLILDRNGEPLVQNVAEYTATLTPEFLPDDKDARYKIYLRLASLTGAQVLEIQTLVKTSEDEGLAFIAIPIKKHLTQDQAIMMEEASVDLPGVNLSITPGRNYPAGQAFSHLLGHIGAQDAKENAVLRKLGYANNEPVGKDGLEDRYESDLRGKIGYSRVEQDAQGRLITSLKTDDAQPGNSLKLSIDSGLQKFVADLLQESMHDTSGAWGDARVAAAVVMSPKTGEVYSMVSLPMYDNNIFAQTDKRADEYAALALDNVRTPFLNHALSAAAPGSTFKLITAAAALQNGNVTPHTPFNVASTRLEIKGENGEIYYLVDWRQHGLIDLYGAIQWSSNQYMEMASCGILGKINGLGKDIETSAVILGNYARAFGLGLPTGIDLYGESDGRVPDPAWKKRITKDPGNWYYADTCFMGIGQGDVTSTPLQIARMTAAVANGGTLVTPHVVNEVVDPSGKTVRTIKTDTKSVGINADYLQVVRDGMHLSVQSGAGLLASQPGIDIAGKTGTAEFFEKEFKRQHAWFTGFAPYNDPDVVVTVYFDLGVGGEKAAPVAGKIIKYFEENVKR
ncbi:MAG: penicillin-binding protein 2 [Tepidiformaceae bacterium]